MKLELIKPRDIFSHFNLDEKSVYLVKVKFTANNHKHKAVLFTGFKSGSNCVVYSNTYDSPTDMYKMYSMKVVKKLAKLR